MIIQHEETGRLATDWPSALPIPKGWVKVECEHLFDGVVTPQTEADLHQHPRTVKVGVIIPNNRISTSDKS